MHWNTPLSVDHAGLLFERLELDERGVHVLDLGCGWGELLPRAVDAGGSGTTGAGVDHDEQLLSRARHLATARGLDRRADFVCAESATWDQAADRVLCIGASHAWPSLEWALHALARLVRPGGRLLFEEGCWGATVDRGRGGVVRRGCDRPQRGCASGPRRRLAGAAPHHRRPARVRRLRGDLAPRSPAVALTAPMRRPRRRRPSDPRRAAH